MKIFKISWYDKYIQGAVLFFCENTFVIHSEDYKYCWQAICTIIVSVNKNRWSTPS